MAAAQPTKKATILRTAFLALALINQVLVSFGKSPLPIDEGNTELAFSLVWTGVASIIAWWKNNSFTKEAKEADTVLRKLKK